MRPESPRQGAIARCPARAEALEVRITRDPAVAAAQALRYQLFYQEMAAQPMAAMAALGRDFDHFDAVCDHLLVIDHARPPGEVVGTYRLLRQEAAERSHGLYSAGEYDLSRLYAGVSRPGALLELGRSCVHRDQSNSRSPGIVLDFFRSRQRTQGSAPRGHAPLGAAPGRARRTTGGPQGTNPARPESGSN